jgi:hypothetical protein
MYKCKFDKDTFIAHPLLTSLFVIDFAMLLCAPLIRFPVLISIVLVCGLVYMSMFFGVKLHEVEQK